MTAESVSYTDLFKDADQEQKECNDYVPEHTDMFEEIVLIPGSEDFDLRDKSTNYADGVDENLLEQLVYPAGMSPNRGVAPAYVSHVKVAMLDNMRTIQSSSERIMNLCNYLHTTLKLMQKNIKHFDEQQPKSKKITGSSLGKLRKATMVTGKLLESLREEVKTSACGATGLNAAFVNDVNAGDVPSTSFARSIRYGLSSAIVCPECGRRLPDAAEADGSDAMANFIYASKHPQTYTHATPVVGIKSQRKLKRPNCSSAEDENAEDDGDPSNESE